MPSGVNPWVFLFNTTIDDLEEGSEDLENYLPLTLDAATEQDGRVPVQDSSSNEDMHDSDDSAAERPVQPLPSTSTPSRPLTRPVFDCPSPILSMRGRREAARKRRKKKVKRLNVSCEGRQEIPHEVNARTEAKWKEKLMQLLRYIDDGFGLSQVNFENSYGFEVNGTPYRIKHAVQAQNVFRHVVRGAEEIGMVVNAKKTAMLCVSDSLSYKADAYMLDDDQQRIGCQDRLKALGFYFSSRPTMDEHINAIARKFRSRYWTLRNLKNSGFSTEELVTVYKTMIRPVADYAAVVYHSSLTDAQDEELDRLQNHALKCIFGPHSGRKLREMA